MRFARRPDPFAFLCNPGEPAGGAPAPAPAAPAHPDFGKPPAAATEPPRPAQVYLSPAEWQAAQDELAALRAYRGQVQADLEAKESERVKALAEKGQIQEAFEITRTQYESKVADATGKAAKLQDKWLNEKRDNALNEALAGVTFAGNDPRQTAAMVRQILANEVEAVLGPDDNPVVRHRLTLRPAVDHLKDRLASPEFAIFLAAQTRGGAGSADARPAATHDANQLDDPNSAFAKAFRDRVAAAKQARF